MPLRLTLAVGTVPVVPVVPVVSVVVWWMMDDGWSWLAGLRVGGVGVWYGGMVVYIIPFYLLMPWKNGFSLSGPAQIWDRGGPQNGGVVCGVWRGGVAWYNCSPLRVGG